jgi:hypothetical protein
MKKFYLLLLCAFLSLTASAQQYSWVINPKGTDADYTNDIWVDDSCRSYITGYFYSTSLDVGNTTLQNTGGIDGYGNPCFDMMVAKVDSAGIVLWAKAFGQQNSSESGTSVAAAPDGSTYVGGWFSGSSFSLGGYTLTNAGNWEGFLAKFDNAGNVQWAVKVGGSQDDIVTGVSTDASGNVFITGYFYSSSVSFGSITLNNGGSSDAFLAKFDPQGNALWAKKIGGTGMDVGRAVAADKYGNAYVCGHFSGSLSIGTTSLSSSGNTDVFIARYDAAGNPLWAKKAGGSKMDHVYAIAVHDSVYVGITGAFMSPSMSFGTVSLSNTGSNVFDCYAAVYKTDGNLVWAKRAGGPTDDFGRGIAFDDAGNSYVTGDFYSASFSFGNHTLLNTDTLAMFTDIFVACFNHAGNEIWMKSAIGYYPETSVSVDVDPAGAVYITGSYESMTVLFDSRSVTNTGVTDCFIAKITPAAEIPNSIGNSPIVREILAYPQPADNWVQLSFDSEISGAELRDLSGSLIASIQHPGRTFILPLSEVANGYYILTIFSDERTYSRPLVIAR